jgi:transposase InsO family protein
MGSFTRGALRSLRNHNYRLWVAGALVSNQGHPPQTMHADERKDSATAFLKTTVARFACQGVTIKRLLTDNGPAYRSRLFNKTCQALGIKHTYTRPYTPQTDGKAERFIQTCLREWAYRRLWHTSSERTAWLTAFLDYYNNRRAHSALGYRPPASRLGGNNLLTISS